MRPFRIACLLAVLALPGALRAAEIGEVEDEFGEGKLRPLPRTLEVRAAVVERLTAHGRGLAPKRPVPRGMFSHIAIEGRQHRAKGSPFAEFLWERRRKVMLAMGLIGPDFRPEEQRAEAYKDAVEGFYHHEHRHFVLRAPDPLPKRFKLSTITVAHEFTHALQDQHFDLSVVRRNVRDDLALAVTGLIEGDAVYSQYVFRFRMFAPQVGQRAGEAALQGALAWASQPVGERPARADLMHMFFPYAYGPPFVEYLLENSPGWAGTKGRQIDGLEPEQIQKAWKLVNEAYRDRPQSTEQILHPAKYLKERDFPHRFGEPGLAGPLAGWKRLDSSEMGEFGLRVWLEEFMPRAKAAAAAAGWDGDRCLVFERSGAGGEDGPFLVASISIWDSVKDAREFVDAATVMLSRRTGAAAERPSADERLVRWRGSEDASGARLERWGRLVALVHGADAEAAAAVADRLFKTERRVDYGDRKPPKP